MDAPGSSSRPMDQKVEYQQPKHRCRHWRRGYGLMP
jgi:hypothetical protein